MKDAKIRRQHIIIIACLAAVILAFFGAVYQSYRYEELYLKVSSLENTQNDKIEKNKQSIASISVLSAPARIEALAKQDPLLKAGYPQDALIIHTSIAAANRPTVSGGSQTSSTPSAAGPGTGATGTASKTTSGGGR